MKLAQAAPSWPAPVLALHGLSCQIGSLQVETTPQTGWWHLVLQYSLLFALSSGAPAPHHSAQHAVSRWRVRRGHLPSWTCLMFRTAFASGRKSHKLGKIHPASEETTLPPLCDNTSFQGSSWLDHVGGGSQGLLCSLLVPTPVATGRQGPPTLFWGRGTGGEAVGLLSMQ